MRRHNKGTNVTVHSLPKNIRSSLITAHRPMDHLSGAVGYYCNSDNHRETEQSNHCVAD